MTTELQVRDHLTFRLRILGALGLQAKLKLRADQGYYLVSDGRSELAIVAPKRIKFYRNGIASRFKQLLRQYSVGTAVTLRPGDLVVNFGANIGELILAMSDSGSRFVAIDPDPVACRCLRRNVGSRADIVETGLWKQDGDVTFYQKPENADTTAIDRVGPPITVRAKKLDTIMAAYEGRVRLIVGDAEGAEPEVMLGALGTLSRTDYLSIAVGPERSGERTYDACAALAREAGFEILPSNRDRLLARNRDRSRD